MKTGLKRTTRHVHMTQWDGLHINRTIWTDESGQNEFIKINGFVFDLKDVYTWKNWTVDFIW